MEFFKIGDVQISYDVLDEFLRSDECKFLMYYFSASAEGYAQLIPHAIKNNMSLSEDMIKHSQMGYNIFTHLIKELKDKEVMKERIHEISLLLENH